MRKSQKCASGTFSTLSYVRFTIPWCDFTWIVNTGFAAAQALHLTVSGCLSVCHDLAKIHKMLQPQVELFPNSTFQFFFFVRYWDIRSDRKLTMLGVQAFFRLDIDRERFRPVVRNRQRRLAVSLLHKDNVHHWQVMYRQGSVSAQNQVRCSESCLPSFSSPLVI